MMDRGDMLLCFFMVSCRECIVLKSRGSYWIRSAAVGSPVTAMETAGEGGPYGMALLAAYLISKDEGETLEDFLDQKVFANSKKSTLMADEEEVQGFSEFLEKYEKDLAVERVAVESV